MERGMTYLSSESFTAAPYKK